MRCGSSTFISEKALETRLHRFRCKQWKCNHCRPKRMARLAKEAYLGKPTTFMTLTVSVDDWPDKDAAAQELVRSFRRMREELQRKHGWPAIPFIAVFEKTEQGWPHLHILMRAKFIKQRWISNYMRRRMKSPIVDIRRIRNRRAAASYVAAYLKKEPWQFQRCKRYWRNQTYLPPKKKDLPPQAPWHLDQMSFETMARLYGDKTPIETLTTLEFLVVEHIPP